MSKERPPHSPTNSSEDSSGQVTPIRTPNEDIERVFDALVATPHFDKEKIERETKAFADKVEERIGAVFADPKGSVSELREAAQGYLTKEDVIPESRENLSKGLGRIAALADKLSTASGEERGPIKRRIAREVKRHVTAREEAEPREPYMIKKQEETPVADERTEQGKEERPFEGLLDQPVVPDEEHVSSPPHVATSISLLNDVIGIKNSEPDIPEGMTESPYDMPLSSSEIPHRHPPTGASSTPEEPPVASEEAIEHEPTPIEAARQKYANALNRLEEPGKGIKDRIKTALERTKANKELERIWKLHQETERPLEDVIGEAKVRSHRTRERIFHALQMREEHINIRAQEAQRRIEAKRAELLATGMTEAEADLQVSIFKRTELFDELIAHEQELLAQARVEGIPPQRQSGAKRLLAWYGSKSKTTQRLMSAGVIGGITLLVVPSAAASMGALGYIGLKGVRTLVSGAAGRVASELTGKAYDRLTGKVRKELVEEKETDARHAFRNDLGGRVGIEKLLTNAEAQYKESLEIVARGERRKRGLQIAAGLAAGIGTSMLAEHFVGSLHTAHASEIKGGKPAAVPRAEVTPTPHPEVTEPAPEAPDAFLETETATTAADHATPELHPETAATIHGNLPDAPSAAAAHAVEGSVEHAEHVSTIGSGGNIWKSAKEIQAQLGLSKQEFAKAWMHSNLAERNLVHAGDQLSFVPETNGVPAHFEFAEAHGVSSPGHVTETIMTPQGEATVEQFPTSSHTFAVETVDKDVAHIPLETVHEADHASGAVEHAPMQHESPAPVEDESWREGGPKLDEMEKFRAGRAHEIAGYRQGGSRYLHDHLELVQPGSPEFAHVLQDRIHASLDTIYGGDYEHASAWNVWRGNSIRQLLNMDTTSIDPESPTSKLIRYLTRLSRESGVRPRFFRFESVEAFIQRAEARRLTQVIRSMQ